MSGGVDSAVAAALLKRQGYNVAGVFLCLGLAHGDEQAQGRSCCSPQDAADARRVADKLGIDLHVLNVSDAFEPIIEDFVNQYALGNTPNPCIACNARVKFARLLARARDLGAGFVATGHYARRVDHDGCAALARASARAKDQSYALFALEQRWLEHILLPIGELADKQAARAIARDCGLPVHDKPDSQEICFVPDDDYPALLARRRPEALTPGPIVDTQGRLLGRHDGYARYTIGQRKGLGVAAGVPMYVTAIDPATATVTLGTLAEVQSRRLRANRATWHAPVGGSFAATVQVRYNHAGARGQVTVSAGGDFDVAFDEPVTAITPGQAAVVYDGQRLLGGGWITQ
jgi:tRNA-specific 2-thiouridylase